MPVALSRNVDPGGGDPLQLLRPGRLVGGHECAATKDS